MKRVYIKTYGCQMNERDSEAVTGMTWLVRSARGVGLLALAFSRCRK